MVGRHGVTVSAAANPHVGGCAGCLHFRAGAEPQSCAVALLGACLESGCWLASQGHVCACAATSFRVCNSACGCCADIPC